MSRSSHRTLLDHGRRAGLNTSELYAALSTRPPEGRDTSPGLADSNGYIAQVDEEGRRVFRPITPPPAS